MDLLSLATAGSVDDGKSTLVGRLLYDTKSVLADQLAAVERVSRDRGFDGADLALLTDGLRAEREQGITIDVAYRYFSTADPVLRAGRHPRPRAVHAQHGDRRLDRRAGRRPGRRPQRRGRADPPACDRRRAAPRAARGARGEQDGPGRLRPGRVRPDREGVRGLRRTASASRTSSPFRSRRLLGDNVVERSPRTPWYDGPTLLEHLEQVPVERDPFGEAFRFPVQTVIRPQTADHVDYRGYAGKVASGVVRPGDEVVVQPRGRRTTVVGIDTFDGPLDLAHAGQSVTLRLADDIDVARGDLIAAASEPATETRELTGTVCWLAEAPSVERARVLVRTGTRTVRAVLDSVSERLDIDTLEVTPAPGRCSSTTSAGSASGSPSRSRSTTTRSTARPVPSLWSTSPTARPWPPGCSDASLLRYRDVVNVMPHPAQPVENTHETRGRRPHRRRGVVRRAQPPTTRVRPGPTRRPWPSTEGTPADTLRLGFFGNVTHAPR